MSAVLHIARNDIMYVDYARDTERLQSCAWINKSSSRQACAVLCIAQGAIMSADDLPVALQSVCSLAQCSIKQLSPST